MLKNSSQDSIKNSSQDSIPVTPVTICYHLLPPIGYYPSNHVGSPATGSSGAGSFVVHFSWPGAGHGSSEVLGDCNGLANSFEIRWLGQIPGTSNPTQIYELMGDIWNRFTWFIAINHTTKGKYPMKVEWRSENPGKEATFMKIPEKNHRQLKISPEM